MKKHIALLIFSVLLLQLVSCGSSTDDVQTSMELPDAETVERQTEKETDYLDQYTGVDYEGAVYTFGTTSNAQYPKVTSKKSAHPSFISILCIFLTRLLKKRAPNVLFYPYSGANPPRIWNYSLNWA